MRKTQSILPLLSAAYILANLAGCGLATPDYKPYDIEETSSDPGTTGDQGDPCTTAQSLWSAKMKSTVDARCSANGCHAGAALDLKADQDQENRDNLYAYMGGSVETLTNKIHGGTHTGGNFTSALSADAITAWHDAEASCQ